MALSQQQRNYLFKAIENYSFPPDYYDFDCNVAGRLADTKTVEVKIGRDLKSGDPGQVKNGLSNVLYWGYARVPYRAKRVSRFRESVNAFQLTQASALFSKSLRPSVVEIKKLGLPEFSGLSFVSKIRMFLDPENSAVLDKQILKIHQHCQTTVLENLHVGKSTQIPITRNNSETYERWCSRMKEISSLYFDARFRAVDVERGFFQLIQDGSVVLAAQILKNA